MTPEDLKRQFPNASASTLRLNVDAPFRVIGEQQLKPAVQAEREVGHGGLQEQIRAFCAEQWPKWLVIQARSDQRSTIAVGAHDFTVFLPGGRLLCVETKAKGKKQTPEQLAWAKQMEMLGHTVHVCRSLDEFRNLALLK